MVKLQPFQKLIKDKPFQKFPLWHGKVATKAMSSEKSAFSMFPLWHGKVATHSEREDLVIPCARFRFGMVKLQPCLPTSCRASAYRFRFGMVKLQPTSTVQSSIAL